jgi:hypothetical protein
MQLFGNGHAILRAATMQQCSSLRANETTQRHAAAMLGECYKKATVIGFKEKKEVKEEF